MSRLILLNKPYGVLSQFTPDKPGQRTLAELVNKKGFYPAGRLDQDSEGLLLLTDDGRLQHLISHPKKKMTKTYLAQVEGEIDTDALQHLEKGVLLKDGHTRPAKAHRISAPDIPERNPPVRKRKNIPTSWVQLTITEGKNRQVRRMTAATGFPTLRLIRLSIGPWELDQLKPGEWKEIVVNLPVSR